MVVVVIVAVVVVMLIVVVVLVSIVLAVCLLRRGDFGSSAAFVLPLPWFPAPLLPLCWPVQ